MALYTIFNKSINPVVLNTPGSPTDDLYLAPGATGFSTVLPTLTTEMAANLTITVVGDGPTALSVETGRSQVRVTPLTGATVTVAADTSSLIIQPAGTIATLTVNLAATPTVRRVKIMTTQIVTTLTMGGGGSNTLLGALTAGTANGFAEYEYLAATTTWYRCG